MKLKLMSCVSLPFLAFNFLAFNKNIRHHCDPKQSLPRVEAICTCPLSRAAGAHEKKKIICSDDFFALPHFRFLFCPACYGAPRHFSVFPGSSFASRTGNNVNATRESPMRGGAVGLARKLRTGRKIQVSVRRGRESEGSHTTHLHACVSVSLC